jgi:poly(A) polymerase
MIDLLKILTNKYCDEILDKLANNTSYIATYLPELLALKGVDEMDGKSHKDNYYHTLKVLKQVSEKTDNIKIKLIALFHDIGKPLTKQFINDKWTFHNHEYVGYTMIDDIFKRLNINDNNLLQYVKNGVRYNGFIKELSSDDVTDSAIRRFVKEVGEELTFDLLFFAKYDITTKYDYKRAKMIADTEKLELRIKEIIRKDKENEWRCPIDGNIIMKEFNLKPSKLVSDIKKDIEQAIKNDIIDDDYDAAFKYMLNIKDKYIK